MDKLFLLARQMAEPNVWSAGVELARNAIFDEEPLGAAHERVFRIAQGRRDAIVSVTLSEANELWQCDCSLDEDPCRHVVATILAVKQGNLASSAVLRRATSSVSHEFSRVAGALRFDRFLNCNHPETGAAKIPVTVSLLQSIAEVKRHGYIVMPNDAELRIDHVLPQSRQGILDPRTMRFLLPALSRVTNVSLDGERVAINPEPIAVVVEVIDEDTGFRLRRARLSGVTEIFDNGVAISDGALRAVEDSSLRMDEIELLRADGSFFPAAAAIDLATRILPQLRGKIQVSVLSKRIPRVRRIAPRVVIEAVADSSGESLVLIPRLVYGEPIIAQVRSSALELLDPREIPIREIADEARLGRELLLRTGLRLDQSQTFYGEAALDNLKRLQGWQIVGEGAARFRPRGELSARAEINNGSLEISFEIADDKGGVHGASAKEVLAAWQRGAKHLKLHGAAGWSELPIEWLRAHGVALERIVAAASERAQAPGRLVAEVQELCESLQIEPPEYFKRLSQGLAEVASIPDVKLPHDLRADLRAYQRTGVNWIAFLHNHGLGALLADDMGLGKTLQALCVITDKTLIVCPTSVLASWKQQIELFRPMLRVGIYHGTGRELVADCEIILTSFALLRLDIERLAEISWNLVVLDEAQIIRNPSSQVAQAAYRLRANNRLSLSGTPVENSLDDLWSHFRFLNPGLLGEYREFQERFAQPIELGQAGPKQELRRRTMPFIMRRLKREVARELPPKTEIVLQCELTDQERTVYEAVLGMVRGDVLQALESNRGMFSVLEVLLRLRQACCHIGLLPGHAAPTSSKLELLIDSLQASRLQGHRALVFSQWTSLLDLIEPHMKKHSISFCRIDGTTQGRGDLVERFQSPEGPDVMLLSLKAGGLGLTLTAADHVYIIDPWWNPAAEDQAADRAYRIGQNNPVIVHRLVAKDTIEERILQIQNEKRALLTAAIGESGSLSLSREDLLRLL